MGFPCRLRPAIVPVARHTPWPRSPLRRAVRPSTGEMPRWGTPALSFCCHASLTTPLGRSPSEPRRLQSTWPVARPGAPRLPSLTPRPAVPSRPRAGFAHGEPRHAPSSRAPRSSRPLPPCLVPLRRPPRRGSIPRAHRPKAATTRPTSSGSRNSDRTEWRFIRLPYRVRRHRPTHWRRFSREFASREWTKARNRPWTLMRCCVLCCLISTPSRMPPHNWQTVCRLT